MTWIRRLRRAIVPGAALVGVALITGCVGAADEPARDSNASSSTPVATPTAPPTTDGPTTGPSPADPTTPAQEARALEVLASLPVRGRAPLSGYDRARFGQAWLDADRNGCDTRNDVLGQRLTDVVHEPGTRDCVVANGTLADSYTAKETFFVRGDGLVDVDHVVALANVWVTGGSGWDVRRRAAIANDPMNLEPVDSSTNRQKGAGDAATWLPPNKPYRCAYVARQVAVKGKYALWVTPAERSAIERILAGCPDERVPEDSGAPTSVSQNIHDPFEPSADPSAEPSADPSDRASAAGSVYYVNCDAARAAGAAPIRRGDPGYGRHLDREGDGAACE